MVRRGAAEAMSAAFGVPSTAVHMSATGQEVSDQITQMGQPPNPQAFGGQQVTWDQLVKPLNASSLPPLPTSDSAAASASASSTEEVDTDQPPPGPEITPPPPPLTGDQTKGAVQDIIAQTKNQQGTDQALIDAIRESEGRQDKLSADYLKSLYQYAPPTPPAPDANPLTRMAPLLFLAAFGGKLTKLDANAMLGATQGTIDGFLKGDQQKFANATKQYDQAYQQYQDRRAQQKDIYDTMRQSYKDMLDGDIRALQAAHEMTGDAISADQKLLDLQDHWQQVDTQLRLHNQDMKDRQWYQRANLKLRQQAAARAAGGGPGDQMTDDQMRTAADYAIGGGKDPSFGLGKNATRDRYNQIKAQQIAAAGGPQAALGKGIETKGRTAEATSEQRAIGGRAGGIETALQTMVEPNGAMDQYLQTARTVNYTQFKPSRARSSFIWI